MRPYRYRFDRLSGWQFWVGCTAKVRAAEIRLVLGDTVGLDDDTGFEPLLHPAARYRSSDRWSFDADFDGLAAGPGRAIDLGLRFNSHFDDRWSLGLGCRSLEGGVDNSDVYNFAWFNSAMARLRLTFWMMPPDPGGISVPGSCGQPDDIAAGQAGTVRAVKGLVGPLVCDLSRGAVMPRPGCRGRGPHGAGT